MSKTITKIISIKDFCIFKKFNRKNDLKSTSKTFPYTCELGIDKECNEISKKVFNRAIELYEKTG